MNKTYALPLVAGVLAMSFVSQNAFATCKDIDDKLKTLNDSLSDLAYGAVTGVQTCALPISSRAGCWD